MSATKKMWAERVGWFAEGLTKIKHGVKFALSWVARYIVELFLSGIILGILGIVVWDKNNDSKVSPLRMSISLFFADDPQCIRDKAIRRLAVINEPLMFGELWQMESQCAVPTPRSHTWNVITGLFTTATVSDQLETLQRSNAK